MSDNSDILFNLGRVIGELSRDAKLELIRSTLPGFFDRNIGITEAMQLYRDSGFKFADSAFREIFNESIFEYKSTTAIQTIPRDEEIPESILATSKYKLTSFYRFVAQVTIINNETNLPEYRYFTMDTEEIGTVEEIENRMLDFYVAHYGSTPERVVSIRIVQGQKDI